MRAALSAALFCVASVVLAAPPSLELPAEVRPANGYARLTPKTDAVGVVYVALDGVYPFPSEELKNPKAFVLPVSGLKDGRYRFVAVAAGKGGEQSQGEFVVVIGAPGPGPDPIPPPKPKPQPDGELGLRKVSRDAAGKVAESALAATKALAAANRATASAVAAGAAVKDGVFSPGAALDLWRAGNRQSGADPAAWAPWATAASDGLAAAYKGGKLGTAGAWAGAFNELADGLEDER